MDAEKLFLPAVFALLLFLGVGNLWDHRLAHEFPYSYFASDTFQQQTRAEGIKDAGNYRHEPFYIVKGYRDVIGYYPALLHHLGIVLSYSSGIPLYDTIYFMVFFSAMLAAFVMYIIIRKFSRQVALLSLPLLILIFSGKSYIGFTWGHWASIAGQLFFIAVIWSVSRLELKGMPVLLGLLIGAIGLSHTSELIYAGGVIAIYAIVLIITKDFSREFAKKVLIAGIISLIIISYNFYIFSNSFAVINPYEFIVSKDWGGTPIFELSDFKLAIVFIAIGAVSGIFMVKSYPLPVIAGFYALVIGYGNYAGLGIRAYQIRLLWPVYFSFFFGLGIHFLLKLAPKSIRGISVMAASSLLILSFSALIPIPKMPSYAEISSPGLMDPWHWQAFQWIGKNTPEDSKIYFFYGDVYDQDAILRNSKRAHAQVIPEDFVASLQNRSIRKIYGSEAPADHGAGMPYFKSPLKIGLHQVEDTQKENILWANRLDVCIFNYFVFDKMSRQPVLAQYNLIIADNLIGNGAQKVFENEVVLILKNNKAGGDCIEERNF